MRTRQLITCGSAVEIVEQYPSLSGVLRHQALAAAPLLLSTGPLGALGVSFQKPRQLSADERGLLRMMATQCAQAIERSRLFDEAQAARLQAEQSLLKETGLRRQLEASEERLRRVVASGMMGIAFWDWSGHITSANDTFYQMLGYTQAQLSSRSISDLTPASSQAADQVATAELRARGTCTPYEKEFLRADGSTIPVLLGAAILDDRSGVAFAVDSTLRREAQRRAEQFQVLMKALSPAVTQAQVADTLACLSSETLGISAAALVVRTAEGPLKVLTCFGCSSDVQAGAAAPARICQLIDAASAEQPGPQTWAALPARSDDRVLGYLVLGASAPRALVSQSDGFLSSLADHFGLALDRARLYEEAQRSQQEALAQVEVEQMIVGVVSHDLKSPVGTILLSAQTLLHYSKLEPRERSTIERISSSASRVARMIADLLDFTQARLGGGIPIRRSAGSLEAIVRQAVDEARSGQPERQIDLHWQGASHGSWDGDRVHQLLSNLVGNALSYGLPQTPITVRGQSDGGRVTIEIHNFGPPIHPGSQARLFQPMQRDSAIQSGGNIGLGLYIVKQICAAHGGSISVRSTAEEGTTFRIELPLHPARAVSAEDPAVQLACP